MTPYVPWRIAHVDLSATQDEWGLSGGESGIFVVFWSSDVPLGSAWLDPRELPLLPAQVAELAARVIAPAAGFRALGDAFAPPYPSSTTFNARRSGIAPLAALRELDAPLHGIAKSTPKRDEGAPTLSVVICTRERPHALASALQALRDSSEPADEIMVVDNAPTSDATKTVVQGFPGVRYLLEPEAGLSHARNAGVRAARGALVAFTDDDVEVHPRWTARVRATLADGDHAAMTGLVLPASLEEESEYLFETKIGGFSQGFRRMVFDAEFVESTVAWGVPVWRMGAGANMAFRRETLQLTGGFDERLGAGRAGCSEDSEMWYRILNHGLSCVYEPSAVVFHRHRSDLTALRRQMHAYMRGHVAALLAQYERSGDTGNLKRVALSLPKYYMGRIVRRLTTVEPSSPSTILEEITGSLAGVGYYLRHRRSGGAPAFGAEDSR